MSMSLDRARRIVEADRIVKAIECDNDGVVPRRRQPVTDPKDAWNKLVKEARVELRDEWAH